MQVNIYKDKLLGAHLFGTSVLYSAQPIPCEDVPQGWYCYDLRGTVRHPDEPYALVDQAEDCHAGSVLSHLPLKSGRSQKRLVKNMFHMLGTNPTLAEFCASENIRCPETPLRHTLCPASPEDAGLFYALEQKQSFGLMEKGREMLQEAADPSKAHSYSWYVIENLNDPEHRIMHELPLEDAIRLYASLDCEDKRLGVTKDDIAAVDLVIRHDGREWVSEDWTKSESFAQDPTVADAVTRMRQLLEDQAPTQGMTMGGMA